MITETPTGILERCTYGVPVNCPVAAAIEAHRTATNRHGVEHTLAQHALRAVILARTPDISDERAMFDYLSGVPEKAWGGVVSGRRTIAEIKEATLAGIARSISWRSQN